MLHEKIADLKRELLEFSALVETMIVESIRGLIEKDKEALKKIINEDEDKANQYEINIEEKAIGIMATHEPRAVDLRTITMMLKMNNDLERMGDHAANISATSINLINKPPVKPYVDMPRMAHETTTMLKDSINAFINDDVELAERVCKRDNVVDNLNDQIIRELVTYIAENPDITHSAIRLINISRNLERIADLATNIAEDVVFIVNGKMIKHQHEF